MRVSCRLFRCLTRLMAGLPSHLRQPAPESSFSVKVTSNASQNTFFRRLGPQGAILAVFLPTLRTGSSHAKSISNFVSGGR